MAGERSREFDPEVESRRFRVERPVKVEVESFCLEHEPAFSRGAFGKSEG